MLSLTHRRELVIDQSSDEAKLVDMPAASNDLYMHPCLAESEVGNAAQA